MIRWVVVAVRLVAAALSLAAVVVQLGITIGQGSSVVNFFSYFTILANTFVSIVLITSAVGLARGRTPSPAAVAVRGASVVYIVFVGVVWFAFLRGVDLGALLPWINAVHHILLPIVALADWLVWPPGRRIPNRVAAMWLLAPAVYTVYSLIRGAITGWYPYPFFNPTGRGYGPVALYSVIMLVAFAAISIGVVAAGRRHPPGSVSPHAHPSAVDHGR